MTEKISPAEAALMRQREKTAKSWGEQAYTLFQEANGNVDDLTMRELSWVRSYLEDFLASLPEGHERDEKVKVFDQVSQDLNMRNREINEQKIDINSAHVPKRYDQIRGRLE